MNNRPARSPRRLALGAAWLLALGWVLLPPLGAQLSRFGKTKGFKVVEYYEALPGLKAQTNQVKSLLAGAEGQVLLDGLVRVTKSRLESYPPHRGSTNFVAVSPESFYDHAARIVFSTNTLDLVAADGRVNVRGWTGYQFSMTNNHFVVSNRVRGFIHGSLLKSPRP